MNPTVEALTEICRIVAAVCQVRALPPEHLGAIVASCRDNDAGMLADVLIGTVPFDGATMRDHE